MSRLTHEEALHALNELRSNVVATQNASWSNMMYPLVAILNDAGFEQFDPTDEQQRSHVNCYGGAGGYPGYEQDEAPARGWVEPISRRREIEDTVARFVKYADDYPEDITGPLRDDFLPQLRKIADEAKARAAALAEDPR